MPTIKTAFFSQLITLFTELYVTTQVSHGVKDIEKMMRDNKTILRHREHLLLVPARHTAQEGSHCFLRHQAQWRATKARLPIVGGKQ